MWAIYTAWLAIVTDPLVWAGVLHEVFGFFKGKRRLRQGDPISTLLFTICFEYLSRILNVVKLDKWFKFHPLCQKIELNHLAFANDLLLFAKANPYSICLLMRAYKTFSGASGLIMNKEKSDIYMNGVDAGVAQRLVSISGMNLGALPIRYLGVNISSTRLSVADYQVLLDKIVARIRRMGARKLSFGGRLTLV